MGVFRISTELEQADMQYRGRIVSHMTEIEKVRAYIEELESRRGLPGYPHLESEIKSQYRSLERKERSISNLSRRYEQKAELAIKHQAGVFGTGAQGDFTAATSHVVRSLRDQLQSQAQPERTEVPVMTQTYYTPFSGSHGTNKMRGLAIAAGIAAAILILR